MANQPKEVLSQGIILDRHGKALHAEKQLLQGSSTKLLSADMSWTVRVEQSRRYNYDLPMGRQLLSYYGQTVLEYMGLQPNMFGASVTVNAAGIDGQEVRMRSQHNLSLRKRRIGRSWPYLMTLGQGDSELAADSALAKDTIDRFLALTYGDIVFSADRTHEAMEVDYGQMKQGVEMLARLHGRDPMDATSYFFNNGDHMIHIIGRDDSHPIALSGAGVLTSSADPGLIEMNIYSVSDGKVSSVVASVNGYAPSGDQPATIQTYEVSDYGSVNRDFTSDEIGSAIDIFTLLSNLGADFSSAFPPPVDVIDQADQIQRRDLEVSLLPNATIDLSPLHLIPIA